jgi:hypothetical protein
MSEHSSNPKAIEVAMLPPLLPVGVVAGVHFNIEVDTQANVIVLPTDRIRTTERGCEIMALAEAENYTEATWRLPPDGSYIHELGKPLPPEHCDVVVVLATVAQDTLVKPVLTPGSPAMPTNVSMVRHRVIMRMPLVDWQAMHMAQLKGPQS